MYLALETRYYLSYKDLLIAKGMTPSSGGKVWRSHLYRYTQVV